MITILFFLLKLEDASAYYYALAVDVLLLSAVINLAFSY
jgi:hypothetical protein